MRIFLMLMALTATAEANLHADDFIQEPTGDIYLQAGDSVQIKSGGDGNFVLQSDSTSDINLNAGGNIVNWAGPGMQVISYGESALVFTDHGLQLAETDSKPECNDSRRGLIYYVQAATGVADALQVCMKLTNDSYSWVSK